MTAKRWYVACDEQNVYDARGCARTLDLHIVEGPAPFGGTIYTNVEQAHAVVDELNRLHAAPLGSASPQLHVRARLPNEPDFTPR